MTAQEAERDWREGAATAWRSAQVLFRAKQYDHALFFAHLSLEKLLKAIIIAQTNHEAPPTHELVWLADRSGFHLSDAQRRDLAAVTEFSVAGRYPSRKGKNRQKVTHAFAREWLARTRILYNLLEASLL